MSADRGGDCSMPSTVIEKYLRVDRLPHIWCPGCGIGMIINGAIRAIDKVGLDQDKTVVVSGIGCSCRATGYMDFDTLHTTHGRALAFATGIKLAKPELNVIVIMGDGDCAAIGGNHFIHAARRNIDVTALVINNQIYGMTGGQYSPTTPVDAMATTAPYGDAEPGFDLCGLAQSAGATFVGRVAPVRMPELINTFAKALQHRGFSFVEAVSQCPIYFGRMNRQGGPVRDADATEGDHRARAGRRSRSPRRLEGKLVTGVLYESERPAYAGPLRQDSAEGQLEGRRSMSRHDRGLPGRVRRPGPGADGDDPGRGRRHPRGPAGGAEPAVRPGVPGRGLPVGRDHQRRGDRLPRGGATPTCCSPSTSSRPPSTRPT